MIAKVLDFLGGDYLRAGLALALVAAVAFAGWRVTTWRASHHELAAVKEAAEATEKALAKSRTEVALCDAREATAQQALRAAEGKALARAAADAETARRIEDALQTRLAAADQRGRDLARRLREHTARACPGAGTVPAAADAAAVAAGAAGEPGDGGPVTRATADHLSACAADSARLQGWQEWWAGVSAVRPTP